MKVLDKNEMKSVNGGRVECRRTGSKLFGEHVYRCCETTRPDWACWTETHLD